MDRRALIRMTALALVLVMFVSVMPISILGAETLEAPTPIGRSYVSVREPDTSFYNPTALGIDGRTASEKIAFVTYKVADLAGVSELPLYISATNGGAMQVYALEGEYATQTLTYNNMPIVKNSQYVGNLTPNGVGEATIDISAKSFGGEYVTFVIRAPRYGDYTYSLDFDDIPIQAASKIGSTAYSGIHRDTGDVETVADRVYSEKTVNVVGGAIAHWVTAAPTVTEGVVADPTVLTEGEDHVLFLRDINKKSGRSKFYNSFKTAALCAYDVGRSFRISFDVLANAADVQVKAGVIAATSTGATAIKTFSLGEVGRTTLTYEVTITEDMVSKQQGLFSVWKANSYTALYIDNLNIVETTENAVYVEDFDDVPLQRTNTPGYTGMVQSASAVKVNRIYSPVQISMAGGTGYKTIVPTPILESGAFTHTTESSSETGLGHSMSIRTNGTGEILAKFFNLFKRNGFDHGDIGRRYHFEVKLLSDSAYKVSYGIRSYGSGSGTDEDPTSGYRYGYYQGKQNGFTLTANAWSTLTFDMTVDKNMVEAQAGLPFIGFASGVADSIIYIDSITVTETARDYVTAEIYHVHTFDREVAKQEALKAEATDTIGAVYYRSCECGLVDTNESNVFELRCVHEYNSPTENEAKVCTLCGLLVEGPANAAWNVRYSADGKTWTWGDIATAVATEGTTVIELYRDAIISEGLVSSLNVTLRSCKELAGGETFSIKRASVLTAAPMVTVNGGALRLENVTVDGALVTAAIDGTGFMLKGGSVTLGEGATVKGIRGGTKYGGAFYVGGGATLNIEGGIITDCQSRRGAGVYLKGSSGTVVATLNMKDGLIEDCTYNADTSMGPAICIENNSSVTLTGGYIVNNMSTRYNSGNVDASAMDADSTADGVVALAGHSGVSLYIGGDIVFRGNQARRLTTRTFVPCDIGVYGSSSNITNVKNRITIDPAYKGTVSIWYPGVTETEVTAVAKAGSGFTAGDILPGVIDASSGRVAKVASTGSIVWTEAVGQFYDGADIRRYPTLAEAKAAAGDAPILLLNHAKASFDAVGDTIKVALDGHDIDFADCPYIYSSTISSEVLGAFSAGDKNYAGDTYEITTYLAETFGAITDVGLTVGSDLTLKIYATLPEAMGEAKIKVTRGDRSSVLNGKKVSGAKYEYLYSGINPQCMGDVLCFELFIDENGNGEVDGGESIHLYDEGYTVKAYCEGILAMSAEQLGMMTWKADAMKTLVRDLLVYGGAAQSYTGYKTDALVSDGVVGSEFRAPTSDKILDVIDATNASFAMATTRFSNAHELVFRFKTNDVSKTKVTIDGVEYTSADFDALGDGVYSVYSEPIYATELLEQVKVCLYYDGAMCGYLLYGFADYTAYMTKDDRSDAMAELAKATYNYGASAKDFKNTDPVRALTEGTVTPIKGKLLGSATVEGNSVLLAGAASGLELRFYGKGENVKLDLTAAAGDRLSVTLDGYTVDHIALSDGAVSYTFEKSYDEGYHTLRVVSESGSAVLDGITLIGYPVAPSEPSELLIEYVGGGATVGETLFEESATDAAKSFAYLSAKALDADYRIVKAEGYTAGETPDLVVVEKAFADTWVSPYAGVPVITVSTEEGADVRLSVDGLMGEDSLPSLAGSVAWGAELAAYIKTQHSALLPSSVIHDGRDMIIELGEAHAETGYQPFYIYTRASDASGDRYIRYHFAYKYSDVRDNYGTNSASNLNLYRVDGAQLVRVNGITESTVNATVLAELLTSGEISTAIKEVGANGETKGDFVGGYHGDEWLEADLLKLRADGNAVAIKDGGARVITCSSVIFEQTSMMYAQGTSDASSHGVELAEHAQYFVITCESGILNRQSLTWREGHTIYPNTTYVQMFTMRRLYGGQSVCEQFATYDGEGNCLGRYNVDYPIATFTGMGSNGLNRTIRYTSATSGISAACGYTALEGIKIGSPYIAVREDAIGDNKWYVPAGSSTNGDKPAANELWVIDCSYKIDYVK